MKVTKAMSMMPSALLAGNDNLQPNSKGLTWEPVMSMGMRARMATMDRDADEEGEASQADNGSMQNVVD
jgi:hypothetical protein